ncbi:hypothetical protein J2857_003599 [Neorhizobium galegae]|uniref:hypothetical protein n=1 Tax=Neorhizobium galegae TaxID=399 RepID=UPI001AE6F2FF|nr:hypothetical protein [Neorhizobium galegae]MBP2560830.1 hypothetical protein [Neorhizobium galegae]
MIPDIDRARLSVDTLQWLKDNNLSTRSASASFPGLNPAMVSRACTEQVLSAASLLTLCRVMQRDPLRYLIFTERRKQNQAVTAIGKRETPEART